MDGAIVVDSDCTKIIRAATQLVPDPSILTTESGTRHRHGGAGAKQTGIPVISVSQSMRIVAIYVDDIRYVLEDAGQILSRANQALATLERYKLRLDEVSGTLSALEIEDLVTVRDVAAVAQRLEMVRRIASEIEGYVVELGTDGRLLSLQLDELVAGVDVDRELVARDYLPTQSTSAHGRGSRGRARWAVGDRPARPGGSGPAPRLRRWRRTARHRRARADIACWPRAAGRGCGDRAGHRSFRRPAEAAGSQHRRSPGRRRRVAGPQRARGLSRLAESSILERYV